MVTDVDLAISPDGRYRQVIGEDLLVELFNRYFIIIHILASFAGDNPRPGHCRGNQEGCGVLGDRRWVQRAARDRGVGCKRFWTVIIRFDPFKVSAGLNCGLGEYQPGAGENAAF